MNFVTHELDNPAYGALAGPHRSMAIQKGASYRYPHEVAPFMALPDQPSSEDWNNIVDIADKDPIVLMRAEIQCPQNWTVTRSLQGFQMLAPEGLRAEAGDVVMLHQEDVPDMLALTALTAPGPFGRQTLELGHYFGIRHEGKLVAMAGERFCSEKWTEISAVCTAPEYRGQGFARRLVTTVAAHIGEHGKRPYLHVVAHNESAIRLYESLGFVKRTPICKLCKSIRIRKHPFSQCFLLRFHLLTFFPLLRCKFVSICSQNPKKLAPPGYMRHEVPHSNGKFSFG